MGQMRRGAIPCLWSLAVWLACCVVAACYASPMDQQASEYEVKSAFLLNFIKFVEWPTAQAGLDAPFAICILGYDPFGRVLDRMVDGEIGGGRRVVVQRTSRPLPETCRVLFAGRDEKGLRDVLARPMPGVLTVGEGDAFLKEGGMIAFILENRRVRFDINQEAARRAGLRISSKLLSVARYVAK